jgi:hypothetical protein
LLPNRVNYSQQTSRLVIAGPVVHGTDLLLQRW